MNKNNKIDNNIETIKKSTDWDEKISLIKNTKLLIQNEKKELYKFKNKLNEDLDEDIDFESFDLDSVIAKINKTNNLSKKIKYLKYLKQWFNQQKNTVL